MMKIREIHLIHHTHCDIGYTDLPSSALGFLPEYLKQAIAIAERTTDFPEESRIHYTCEITEVFQQFLKTASLSELKKINRLLATGQFELGAMPFHITPLLETAEWNALLEAASPLFRKYPLKTCFQNDINGLPWGLLPSFAKNGVEFVMMGINTYSGGVPLPQPSAFWWEGPDKTRVLTWLGSHYCDGYFLFHPEEWRRGPIPSYSDPWFGPPRGREIFDERPKALRKAHAHLRKKLAETYQGYEHPILGLQVTNMWRLDNDPPCEQLSHFVRAWNEAGYEPRLRLSTPTKFLTALRSEVGESLPVLRGDWVNWWADGPVSMPTETALAQRSKKLLADLSSGAKALRANAPDPGKLAEAWRNAGLYTEHTFASWNSLASPYEPLSLGGVAQKADFAYRSDEEGRNLRAEIIRSAPRYLPVSQTRYLTVCNPGAQTRSGWVELSLLGLREPANAVEDLKTGAIHPLEDVITPNWSSPKPATKRPYEMPDDIFSFQVTGSRFFHPPLAGGSSRRYRLVNRKCSPPTAKAKGQSGEYSWKFDPSSGLLRELRHEPTGLLILDSDSTFGLGQPIFEQPQGFGARELLLNRQPTRVRRRPASFVSWTPEPSAFGASYRTVWKHPVCHRIEQVWNFLESAEYIELTSTFWLKETLAPLCIYLAFPFLLPDAQATYDSLGWRTRVGLDQIPGTCGEYHATGDGVEWISPKATLALTTVDTPLVMFQSPAMRTGRKSFVPDNAHAFPVITQNYWVTNFPHIRAAKVSVRHLIACSAGSVQLLKNLNPSLWAFPSS